MGDFRSERRANFLGLPWPSDLKNWVGNSFGRCSRASLCWDVPGMLRHPCSISGQGGTAHAPSNVPILGQLVLIIRCLTHLGFIWAASWPHDGPILGYLGLIGPCWARHMRFFGISTPSGSFILVSSWAILASWWPHLGLILGYLGPIVAPSNGENNNAGQPYQDCSKRSAGGKAEMHFRASPVGSKSRFPCNGAPGCPTWAQDGIRIEAQNCQK